MTRFTDLAIALTIACPLVACDSVDVGRLEESADPPQLLKLLIIDEARGIVSDQLNTNPMLPACSETEPCPVLYAVYCEDSNPDDDVLSGQCVDDTSVARTPPPVAEDFATAIRFVFSERFAVALSEQFEGDMGPSIIGLSGPNGPVAATRYYDPAGSPTLTTDFFAEPYGPALVIRPDEPVLAGASYTMALDLTKLLDPDGKQAVAMAQYTFTTEDLAAVELGEAPEIISEDPVVAAPNHILRVRANAPIDADGSTIEVRRGNDLVNVLAYISLGGDPADCEGGTDLRQLNIVRTSSAGAPLDWDAGEHTFRLMVKAEGSTSNFEVMTTFTVEAGRVDPAEDAAAHENFVTPAQCEGN